jgi:hypothetical protein
MHGSVDNPGSGPNCRYVTITLCSKKYEALKIYWLMTLINKENINLQGVQRSVVGKELC